MCVLNVGQLKSSCWHQMKAFYALLGLKSKILYRLVLCLQQALITFQLYTFIKTKVLVYSFSAKCCQSQLIKSKMPNRTKMKLLVDIYPLAKFSAQKIIWFRNFGRAQKDAPLNLIIFSFPNAKCHSFQGGYFSLKNFCRSFTNNFNNERC